MSQPVVFRPRGGVILAIIAMAVCVAALIFIVLTEDLTALFRWGWPIVLLAWSAWVLYVQPAVTVTDGFVEVRNLVRTHRVPWGDLDSVDTRFALTLVTKDGRKIQAWAAPAPGARQALSTRREEVSLTPGEGDSRRPSDSETSFSGGAAALVRRHLAAYQHAGGASLGGGTTTNWHVAVLAVSAVLVAATLLSFFAPHG
ncbi:PH domain-containing protein [Microbacterium sp. NPDC076911]|uniref:PH domain-containing protein n=1 Tax=unclassified Microbacterium TaxID=2609290 RepID=UPI00343E3EDE